MLILIKFLALVAVLFLGAGGWGTTFVALLRRAGWDSAHEDVGPPLQVLLGVALFLIAGGFLVALNLANLPFLFAWHVVGLVLLVARRLVSGKQSIKTGSRSVASVLAAAVLGLVLLLISLGFAIGQPYFDSNDDDPAYIYLAQRLIHTGGMIDPFNLRRMTGYGGSTLYQAMFLGTSGNSSLRGFELTFGILLLLLITCRTVKRRWLLAGSFLIGLGLLLGHGIGPFTNLGPTFSASALSLGAFQLMRRIPSERRPDQPMLYCAIGTLFAAILALRFYYLIPVGIAGLFVLMALRGRRSALGILLLSFTTVVCIAGWALASFRSSGSLLFPLMAGNYDTAGLGASIPSTHLIDLVRRYGGAFNGSDVGIVAASGLLIAIGYLLFSRRQRKGMLVLLAASIGCLIELAILTYSLRGSFLGGIVRFCAPSTLACGLLAIDLLWSTFPIVEHSAGPTPSLPCRLDALRARITSASDWRERRAIVSAPVVVIGLLGWMGSITFGWSLPQFAHLANSDVRQGAQVATGKIGFADRYRPFRDEYTRINQLIPTGSKVFVAVERPALLAFSRFDFATLDGAGSVSPPPHMPYFQGAIAKVNYLRHLGYQYVVTESPTNPGLYNINMFLHLQLRSGVFFDRVQATYYIDWAATVRRLESSGTYPVLHAGSLALIKIS